MNPKAQVAKAKTCKWDFSSETASELHSEEGKETIYGSGMLGPGFQYLES